MIYQYRTHGTCSREIDLEIENGIIRRVKFHGGCAGNLAGISKIVEGMPAQKVIDTFSGIRCGMKSTSCPDQLAHAVAEALSREKDNSSYRGKESDVSSDGKRLCACGSG